MKRLLVLLLLSLPVHPLAAGVTEGTVQNGYVWRSGLWWRDGVGYRGYRCGCRWCYAPAAHAHRGQVSTATTTDNSITITNTFNFVQQSAEAGSTVFARGASLDYTPLDRDAQLNNFRRVLEQGQQGWLTAFVSASADDAEIARLRAKSEAAAQVLLALESPSQPATQLSVEIGENGQDSQGSENRSVGGVGQILGARCASCHSGEKLSGGLDLSQWPTFDLARKRSVLERIRTSDLGKRMPRLADGAVAEKLSDAEITEIAVDVAFTP